MTLDSALEYLRQKWPAAWSRPEKTNPARVRIYDSPLLRSQVATFIEGRCSKEYLDYCLRRDQ